MINEAETQPRQRKAPLAAALLLVVACAAAVAWLGLGNYGYQSLIAIGALVSLLATFRHQRFFAVYGAVVYIAVFCWIYVSLVVPAYGYSGFVDSRPDTLSLCGAALVAGAPALWLRLHVTRPSDIVIWFLYLFGYVPAVLVPLYVLGPAFGNIAPLEVSLIAGIAVLGVMQRLPRSLFQWSGLKEPVFVTLMIAFGLGAIIYIVVFFGVPTYLPDFVAVYDVRAEFSQVSGAAPGSGYVVTWAMNVIYPLLIALGLSRSRMSMVALGAVGELLIYGVGGYKEALLAVLLVPVLTFVINRVPRYSGSILMWSAVLLIACAAVATIATGSLWPLALGVVRPLGAPGQLTAYFYDFFSTNPTYELSRSILRSITSDRYGIDPPFLIGAIYLHANVDANANVWADAMANFGVPGIVPFSAILGFVLWVLDSVAANRSLVVVGATMGIAGLSLANGSLFGFIGTFGMGITIVVVALMPRERLDQQVPSAERD